MYRVGDLVNPGPFGFPDYERFGLHRNSVGKVIAVAADGRVTVHWHYEGSSTYWRKTKRNSRGSSHKPKTRPR